MISPRPWTEALARHAHAVRKRPEPEAVHQLRVAAGRLAVWLRLARKRALRDDLAWLRGSAARVRDLDVLLERHGAQGWTEEFVRQRAQAAHELVLALGTQRCAGLLQALELLPGLGKERALERLPHLRERLQAAARRALAPAEPELEELHCLRKRVRRLRYALEWLGRESPGAKALQDALGLVRDSALALEQARAAPESTRDGLQRELDDARARVRELWNAFACCEELC
jgi:CHAD domain-containing protein